MPIQRHVTFARRANSEGRVATSVGEAAAAVAAKRTAPMRAMVIDPLQEQARYSLVFADAHRRLG